MNGQINITAVKGIIDRAVAEYVSNVSTSADGIVPGEGVRNLMIKLGDLVQRAANADIDEVAYDIVDRDMVGTDVGTVHKIRAIKDVRTLTMSGLKEAKDAVEYAIGRVLRDRANAALTALAEYNTHGDAYHKPGYRQYVNALAHREVLDNLVAASELPPF